MIGKEQFRKARKLHAVPLEGGEKVGLLDPTLADAKKLQSCREDIGALAVVLQPLIVSDDRRPLFDTPDELAADMGMTSVLAICHFIGELAEKAGDKKKS